MLKKQTGTWINFLTMPDGARIFSVASWCVFVEAEAMPCSSAQNQMHRMLYWAF